ncbi:MAG: glycosyltransferase, partial [Desulfovibrio sp.]
MPLRIILTTGGTGGHIFPALAVAESLKSKAPDAEILFIGGTYGPERE